jgi:alpha-L-rhamnosidase
MKSIISIVLMSAVISVNAQKLNVVDLQCEHRTNPVGIDNTLPRLSWKIEGAGRDILQSSYSIRVAAASDFRKQSIVWETGRVASDESILRRYEGEPLKSGQRYYWQVKVWDNQKRESKWSEAAFWEMGLLSQEDWKARWIEPVQDTSRAIPALHVRKDFELTKPIASARVYVTSHGLYELSLNGRKVGDQVLTPGWTSYNNRLQYQVYDITGHLRQGRNAVGVMLGDGWYRGTLAWEDSWGIYGKKLGVLCQIHIRHTDGSETLVISDGSWKGSAEGPVVMNSIYDGESYDARREMKGWNTPSFTDTAWTSVEEVTYTKETLIATETVPVRRIQELKATKIFTTPKGTLVADFGQNMVGWVRLRVRGTAGTTITIRHAEVLDREGEFYTENLRAAKATMKYVLRGEGEEVFEPRFTFFGFRFIAIDGFPGEVKPENVVAVVVHSDMKVTGTFECSDPLLNQLQKNIVWGQKGNFVDVPTDCPQRDERLGWTGDAQAFARTAAYNMDVAAFFTKWLKDLAADQTVEGIVPPVIPNVLQQVAGSSGWADAATIIPWDMYQVYGDRKFLEDQYKSMKAWVQYIDSVSRNNLWNSGWHFGDWLFFRPADDLDGRSAVTDKYMIAQCFWAHSTQLVINAARVLGKNDDITKFEEMLERVKNAYVKEYLTPSGRLVSGSQTAYVLALNFDMLPEDLRGQAAERLVENIRSYNNHLTTGFLGTPYLCHVLSRFGYNDVAYTLLLQKTYPSWLYPVTQGATTIWERWDGQKPDGSFQNAGMNSFNHYAYGAIGDWMYRVVGGIEIAEPGYRKVRIQPQPDPRLGYARASYKSPYGTIRSAWERKGNQMHVSVAIPPNTTAIVCLPDAVYNDVMEGKSQIIKQPQFRELKQYGDKVTFEVGSGEYVFVYTVKR